MSNKKRGLGKGLSALLENTETDITSRYANGEDPKVAGSISQISIKKIEANPFQPRTKFTEEPLRELAKSIKEHGIIQPVTVRKMGYDKYQLISGERRFRASQIAGLTEIPAYIKIADDRTMLEMALVENIQREDLDAIEVALSYQRLIEECNLTQEELSEKVAKKRATVTNYLRLLKLPEIIQHGIRDKKLSMGHARAIAGVSDEKKQIGLYNLVVDKGISVRQVENLIRESNNQINTTKKSNGSEMSFEHAKIKDDLNHYFGTKVDMIRKGNGKGKITINFYSENDLQRIVEMLNL